MGWLVAGGGWLTIVLLAGALMLLMPLKRVEPYLIRVDSTTGVVDVVPTYTGHATFNQAVTRYFLTHYITVCERFNYATAESDYEECGAFQTPQENEAWYASWNPSNPKSPLNVHKDGSTVSVRVEDVSFFKRASGIQDLAQVRYLTIESQGNDAGGELPSLDRHCRIRVRLAFRRPQGPALESARLQDREPHPRARGPVRWSRAHGGAVRRIADGGGRRQASRQQRGLRHESRAEHCDGPGDFGASGAPDACLSLS